MASKSKISPRLVVIEGKDKGKIIPLDDGTTVIGRSKGDVIVQDARVSRSHVAIHFDEKLGALTFTDLKSLNGSEINGSLQEKGELKDGDRIQLGDTVFDCQIGAPVDEESSVSKVKEEMRRAADPKRKKTELKGSIPEFEPHLLPLDEEDQGTSLPHEPGIALEKEKDADKKDEVSERKEKKKKPKRPRRALVSLNGLKSAVGKVPRSVRNIAMGAVVLLFVLSQLGDGDGPGAGAGNPDVPRALAPSQTFFAQGQAKQALQAAAKVRDEFPEDSRPLTFIGDVFVSERQFELALDAYSKAYQLSPYDPVIHVKLARTLFSAAATQTVAEDQKLYLDKGTEQLALVEERISAGEDTATVTIALGQLYLDFQNLPGGAKKMMEVAKALQTEHAPRNPLGYKLEAKALMSTKQNEDALVVLQRARDLDKADPWTLENLVYAHLANQSVEGAERVLKEWVNLQPEATKALLVLAYLKMNTKKYREALPFVQRIIELGQNNPQDPHLPEAVHLMGQIYYSEGQTQEAATLFQQACRAGFKKSCDAELAIQQPQSPPGKKTQSTQ